MNSRQLAFLAVLMAVGGALGTAIAVLTRSYTASVAIAVDPFSYRSAEAITGSSAELARFAAANGMLELREYKVLDDQLRNGGNFVTFESVNRLRRDEWRDIPEPIIRQFLEPEKKYIADISFTELVKEGRFLHAVVNARAKAKEDAERLTVFGMQYFRYALHLGALRDQFRRWGAQSRAELAKSADIIAKNQALIYSVEQNIISMRDVLERYRGQSAAMLSGGTNLQVVGGERLVSPGQQLIGLESDRIAVEQNVRKEQVDSSVYTYLVRVHDELLPKLESGESPRSISQHVRDWIQRQPRGETEMERLAFDRAKAELEVGLSDIEAKWVHQRTEPEIPAAQQEGIPRSVGLLAGALLGALLWGAFTFRHLIVVSFKRLLTDRV